MGAVEAEGRSNHLDTTRNTAPRQANSPVYRTRRRTPPSQPLPGGGAALLFILSAGATMTAWSNDPFAGWAYSAGLFLAAACVLVEPVWKPKRPPRYPLPPLPLSRVLLIMTIIALWGVVQPRLHQSVFRYASQVAALRVAAGTAALWVGSLVLRDAQTRERFLSAFAWFAGAVSVVGVLAYYTSPGKILWSLNSPYPDTWGFFLSRNEFAMLLELALPVALWAARLRSDTVSNRRFSLGTNRPGSVSIGVPIWVPAWLLAAGFASASRAGVILLVLEAFFFLIYTQPQRARNFLIGRPERNHFAFIFVILSVLFMTLGGVATVFGRFRDPEPLLYRDQIAASAVRIIRDRPWTGFGVGTFRYVYPAYATFDGGALVDHVHNEFLEWGTEGGIVYAFLWIAVAVSTAGPALRSRWGLGLVAIFLHSLVDYPFAKFGVTVWTFALMGAIQAQGEKTSSRPALTLQKDSKEAVRDEQV